MQLYNLKSGKGFVYSLDAIVAIILVIAVIASFNIVFENNLSPSSVVLRKLATDLIIVLNQKGEFYDLDVIIINQEIKKILPKNYGFYYKIKSSSGTVESGDAIEKEDYYSGFAVINARGGFGVLNYQIWQKE